MARIYLVLVAIVTLALASEALAQTQQDQLTQQQNQEQQKKQQQQQQSQQEQPGQTGNVVATKAYRVSVLSNFPVRNPEGEELGDVSDVVVDLTDYKIRYIAVSVGGFLGIGDKLVAVPVEALKLVHDQDETYFVLDVSKQQLESAPGFNEDNWPDFGNPKFAAETSKSFGNMQKLAGIIKEVNQDQLTVQTDDGQTRTLRVGPKTQITLDDEEVEASELAQGQKVHIQTVEEPAGRVVRSVEAQTKQHKTDTATKPADQKTTK